MRNNRAELMVLESGSGIPFRVDNPTDLRYFESKEDEN
jgi:hypothetical protein